MLTLAFAVAASAAPALARQQLASTVSWLDASGRTGQSQFQGYADGPKLTGVVEIEGQAYEVQGTISASGDIAGRLLARGRPAGTFHAKMADDEVLEGKLQLGTESAVWLSPSTRGLADEVPGPPGRLGAPD